MIARLKGAVNNNKGMTMVSVLVAFAVLLFIILMYTQTVELSSKIYQSSEDRRKATEALYSDFYTNTTYSPKAPAAGSEYGVKSESFTFSGSDGSSFILSSASGSFAGSNGGKIEFFGNRLKVEEDGGVK